MNRNFLALQFWAGTIVCRNTDRRPVEGRRRTGRTTFPQEHPTGTRVPRQCILWAELLPGRESRRVAGCVGSAAAFSKACPVMLHQDFGFGVDATWVAGDRVLEGGAASAEEGGMYRRCVVGEEVRRGTVAVQEELPVRPPHRRLLVEDHRQHHVVDQVQRETNEPVCSPYQRSRHGARSHGLIVTPRVCTRARVDVAGEYLHDVTRTAPAQSCPIPRFPRSLPRRGEEMTG